MVPLLALASLPVRPVRSSYAVLGLSPGASREAIEAAYRALIKQYHPDLPGGDRERAAQINQAFDLLRGNDAHARVAIDTPSTLAPRPRRAVGQWLLAGGIVAAVLTAPGSLSNGGIGERWRKATAVPVEPTEQVAAPRFRADPSDSALLTGLGGVPNAEAVEAGVTEAVRMRRRADTGAARAFSANCHANLHHAPSAALLDHCLAFDRATVALFGTGADKNDVARQADASASWLSDDASARQAHIAAVNRMVRNLVPEATP